MSKERLFPTLNIKTQFRFLGSRTLTRWVYHTQPLFIIGLLMLMMLCACSQTATHHQKFTNSLVSTPADLRIVKHEVDKIKLPISVKKVLSFVGAPWTLATYAIEGKISTHCTTLNLFPIINN